MLFQKNFKSQIYLYFKKFLKLKEFVYNIVVVKVAKKNFFC